MARKINFEESGTFNQPEEKPKKTKEEEDSSVNEIFSDADKIIEGQNNATIVSQQKVRKKKNLVKGLVIALIISLILAVVAIAGMIIYAINSYKNSFSEMIVQNYVSVQSEVLSNETLDETEAGKLTKKLASLLTEDDVRYVVEHATNVEDVQKILNLEGNSDLLDLLPENKKEAYKELLKEYESKKDIISKEIAEYNKNTEVANETTIETTEETEPEPTQTETTNKEIQDN